MDRYDRIVTPTGHMHLAPEGYWVPYEKIPIEALRRVLLFTESKTHLGDDKFDEAHHTVCEWLGVKG